MERIVGAWLWHCVAMKSQASAKAASILRWPASTSPPPAGSSTAAGWERCEAARPRHATVDFGLTLFERDSSIGGGLLAGALAYRLFVLLLPSALLFVSGLGLYAGTVDKSPSAAAKEAGLHGLIASQVASTASGSARWLVFVLMVPAVLYATAKLYRAVAVVHAIVWHGSGRGVRITPRGRRCSARFAARPFVAAEIVGWIRRHDQLGGLSALLVYLVLVGGAWLVVSLQAAAPRRLLARHCCPARARSAPACCS